MYDPELYRSKEEVEEWKKRCPIARFEAHLHESKGISEADFAAIEKTIESEIDEAVAFAEAGPWEPVEDLMKDVYTTPVAGP
jgi:TPP-dependent pyruvate/acetoin dehydrogenase alpha subunit